MSRRYISPQSGYFVILLLLTIPVSQLGIDIYTASMPDMVKMLHTTTGAIQNSMTLYLISMGISMLFVGIASEYLGRRRTLLSALTLFSISSFFCVIADNVTVFLIARFFQGLGAGYVVCLPGIMSDVFSGKRLRMITSYNSVIWSVIPVMAPFIGGVVQKYLFWQVNFMIVFVYALIVVFFLYCFFPETLSEASRNKRFKFSSTWQDLKQVLCFPAFYAYALLVLLSWAVMMMFVILGPFLFQTVMGFSALYYGFLALLLGLSYTAGTLINTVLLHYLSSRFLLIVANIGIIVGAIILLFNAMYLMPSVLNIMFPCLITVLFSSFIYPNAWASVIDAFKGMSAGVGSALMNLMIMSGVAFITYMSSFISIASASVLGFFYLGFGCVSLLILSLMRSIG